jgi:hypothetical protein
MSTPPEPGERVGVVYDDGTAGELPPWPTDAELAERDAWVNDQLTALGLPSLDLSQGMP